MRIRVPISTTIGEEPLFAYMDNDADEVGIEFDAADAAKVRRILTGIVDELDRLGAALTPKPVRARANVRRR